LCGGQRSTAPGPRPSCQRCDASFSCNCSSAGLTRVPVVTGRALSLDLSSNLIAAVTAEDLRDHGRLRVLSLHRNRLVLIHPAAFDPLRDLEDLDLSNNQLTALEPSWFRQLEALRVLNLLHNPYSRLGPAPPFQNLLSLRRLKVGGPDLEELRTGDLAGVSPLEELSVQANGLRRYEAGALADIWPLGSVVLSLHRPFLEDQDLASSVLGDVSHPETALTLRDLNLTWAQSIRPLRAAARSRIRHLTFQNLSLSDVAVVELLVVLDGVPLTRLAMEDVTLKGQGRWERANWTDHRSIDEFLVRDMEVLDVYQFVSLGALGFLLQYPRKVSLVNAEVYVMPCLTSYLLRNLQYLDLSDNLLTDMTLTETLCDGRSPLRALRVLNVSGNALKSLSSTSRLLARFHRLSHVDLSRNVYGSMPGACSWPPSLRHLNLSRTRIRSVSRCLPAALEVLDLSHNDLRDLVLVLPALRELHLSGNKFLRLPAGCFFPSLHTLSIQANGLGQFGASDLRAYRRLRDLRAGGNSFVCTCDFVSFFRAAVAAPAVRLTDGEGSYVCDAPLHLRGALVSRVRLEPAQCHPVLVVSAGCGGALLVGAGVGVLLWRVHAFWYLRMTWAWLKAKRSSRRRRGREERRWRRAAAEGEETFDAFVSYSDRDAGWVENFLVPELEAPR
uniref:Toll-like receptor 2 n=1 Tax=Tetraodon nigroviridis TaxID=99883 RepID=H3CBQ9_TETNG